MPRPRPHDPLDADDLAAVPARFRSRLAANDAPRVLPALGPIGQPFYLGGRRKATTPHNLLDSKPNFFVANDAEGRAVTRRRKQAVSHMRFDAEGAPACPYCFHDAVLAKRRDVLRNAGTGGLEFLWQCQPCDAWVFCHDGTTQPMGSLANRDLRRLRHEAHRAFDPVWQTGRYDRKAAYALLAAAMALPVDDCHMGLFGPEECTRVIELCRTHPRLTLISAPLTP